MGTMHRCTSIAVCAVVTLAACAKSDNAATTDSARGTVATDTGAMGAMGGGGATADLSKFAGKWQVRSTPQEGSDTTATTYTLTATSDTTGWTITFPGRAAMPVHVRVDGDSVMVETGQFESIRRKGLKVQTNAVVRMQGDRLAGTSVAHYKTTKADSVLHLRTEGSRVQ